MKPDDAELVVFTDLDGTLLDEETYSFEPACEALAALASRGVTLILCSSKTRAEMEHLARALGLATPLVVENGSAILWPEGGAYRAAARGTPRPLLVAALQDIARETCLTIQGFSTLTVEEVARLTGLAPSAARDALAREYDEPFLADAGAAARVAEAASARGLRVTRGGRFFHLTGPVDKGQAARQILATYGALGRRVWSLGLGDSANDRTMLEAVDRPVIIPRPGGVIAAELAGALPHAERAPAPGPAGWNAAVLAVLRGERLPRAATRM